MKQHAGGKKMPLTVFSAIEKHIAPWLSIKSSGGNCSKRTREIRRDFLIMVYGQLWAAGYRIKKPTSLAEKHIKALAVLWDAEGISPGQLHNRFSMLRLYCDWMGKGTLVKDLKSYFPVERTRRSMVAKTDKSPEGNGVDPGALMKMASELDDRFGLMVAMQHYFGLRVKESVEFNPHKSVIQNGLAIEVHDGAKGGRPRIVLVETKEQADLLKLVMEYTKSSRGSLRWNRLTWKQAQSKFYRLARKIGLTKDGLGLTAHGFRHGFASWKYEKETGYRPPVRGGNPQQIDFETHRMAAITTARALGHGRTDVTTTYYGSYGHSLRPVAMKMQYQSLPT